MDLAVARRLVESFGPDAKVVDVGGGASPFPRADYVVDALPFEEYGAGSDGSIHEQVRQHVAVLSGAVDSRRRMRRSQVADKR